MKITTPKVYLAAALLTVTFAGIAVSFHYCWIGIKLDSAKNILIAILGTSAALFGFIIFNLTVSFEKYKKEFGRRAAKIFRQDGNIRLLVAWIVAVMAVSFIGLVVGDTASLFFNWLFNIACIYFLMALSLVTRFGILIQTSLSAENYTESIINKLQVEDFIDQEDKKIFPMPINELVKLRNTNATIELSEIIYTNIREKNLDAILIISNYFLWVSNRFRDKEISHNSKRIIAINFLNVLSNAFELFMLNKDELSARELLNTIQKFDLEIAENGELYYSLERLFEIVHGFARLVIELENESMIWETLWTVYHIAVCHINRNIPKDSELWGGNISGAGVELREYANDSEEKHRIYDLISKFVTIDIPELFDRILLCRNYFIIDQSLGVFSSILDMLLIESGIDLPQRTEMAGAISYSLANNIRAVMEKRTPHKFPFLSYHLKPSQMMYAITGSFDLGTAVFNEHIHLAEAMRDQNEVVFGDVESLAGLCRLIIAKEKEIHFPETYAASIVKYLRMVHKKLQVHLATGKIPDGERKKVTAIIELIISSMKSFYTYVHRAQEKNKRLEMVVDGLNQYIL